MGCQIKSTLATLKRLSILPIRSQFQKKKAALNCFVHFYQFIELFICGWGLRLEKLDSSFSFNDYDLDFVIEWSRSQFMYLYVMYTHGYLLCFSIYSYLSPLFIGIMIIVVVIVVGTLNLNNNPIKMKLDCLLLFVSGCSDDSSRSFGNKRQGWPNERYRWKSDGQRCRNG